MLQDTKEYPGEGIYILHWSLDIACFSSYNFEIYKNINTIIKTISHSPYERLIIRNFSYVGTSVYQAAFPISLEYI